MTDKAWKQRERQVARFFGGERNPLSGANSKHCGGDVIRDTLPIEVKLRKRHAVLSVWDKAKREATKEGKTPVVCLCEGGRPGFWVLVHSAHLDRLLSKAAT
ncbi:MAG: hypothetical protein JRJ60_16300 [Deltaproteobacteria bacterium]|nr:hypothetical protein [Deltaproteobacteria bacterium]